MKGKEKLYLLLNKIDDAKSMSSSGSPLKIDPILDLNNNINNDELSRLFVKLAEEEKVLKLIKVPIKLKTSMKELAPYDHTDDGCWYVELYKTFDRYFLETQQEPDFTDNKHSQKSQEGQTDSNPKESPFYSATYSEHSREIVINDFLIAKPDFDSENDLVFAYLYKNSHKKFSMEEIEKGIGRELLKDFHKIVENLGFRGDLKRAFFNVSKTSIYFRNPITKATLEQLGMTRIKLP